MSGDLWPSLRDRWPHGQLAPASLRRIRTFGQSRYFGMIPYIISAKNFPPQAQTRACLYPLAVEMTPYPACVRGRPDVPDRRVGKSGEVADPSHMWKTSQNAVQRLKTHPRTNIAPRTFAVVVYSGRENGVASLLCSKNNQIRHI